MESLRMLYKTQSQVLFTGGDGHVIGTAGIFGGYPGNSGYRHAMHGTNMKELFATRQPYPVVDSDPEDSQVSNLVKADKEVFDLHALCGPHIFSENDLYVSIQRGGPGLGDPLERDPKSVEADLNKGDLSPRFARSVYGVVAEHNGDGKWAVDLDATEQHRNDLRRERLDKAIDTSDFIVRERERILKRDFIAPVCDMYRSSLSLSENWRDKFSRFWNLPEDFQF
jgi:N-methylhydantoinase B/acetone carboxylase alpha subunit